jgi:hypothetical protein
MSKNDALYIQSKIDHMNRFGIAAEKSETGAAMPQWMKEHKEAERKRVSRRR